MDPSLYPHDTACTWIIQGGEGSVVRLSFLSFAVERCGRNCACDYVAIYDNNTAIEAARAGGGQLMGK